MPKRRSKPSRRRKSAIKLPLRAVVTLIIIVAIVAGVWAALHPHEAKYYILTWTKQFPGKPMPTEQPARPIPPTEGSDNLAYGIPGEADCIVDREGYALGYSEYHEQAIWVIYRMTAEEATTKVASRNNNFRKDPAIPTGSATPADYRNSGRDRGHLASAADMAFSNKTMDESFYMSNMSPQAPDFNRGVWKRLEEQVRSFAVEGGDIYIVTGPVLPKIKTVTIGANRVTVPNAYYKVIYDRSPPEKMLGFVLPNESSNRPLKDFAVTVDAVEQLTGLDFFSELPPEKQAQLESSLTVNAWLWD